MAERLNIDPVAETWTALIDVFGPLWSKTFGSVPNGVWLQALEELSYEQLERGVRYYATQAATPRAFVPNLPEFRFRCLGIPDKQASINRAIDGDTSTEFLAALVNSVPEYDRRTLATKALYFRFDANYERIVERVLSGDAPRLPPPRPQSYDADPTNTSHLPPQDGLDGQPTHVPDGRAILKSRVQVMFERYHAERVAAEAAATATEKPMPDPDPAWLAAERARENAASAHHTPDYAENDA